MQTLSATIEEFRWVNTCAVVAQRAWNEVACFNVSAAFQFSVVTNAIFIGVFTTFNFRFLGTNLKRDVLAEVARSS